MDILTVIKQRRSIRKYSSEIPRQEDIMKILEAGIWAPSGLNNQPWKFKVIKDDMKKDALARFTKYSAIIKSAPVVICVFLDKKVSYDRDKDIMAVGACIQNMLLEIHELAYGACWLGEILNKKEEVRNYLKIDVDYELMAVITLGCQDKPAVKGSRKELKKFLLE